MAQPARVEFDKNQAAWQCRRGMLELDLLLKSFVDKDFDKLDENERIALKKLLEYPDNLLLEYLLGRLVPSEDQLARVVDKIRFTSET